jgi:hypothetical protein
MTAVGRTGTFDRAQPKPLGFGLLTWSEAYLLGTNMWLPIENLQRFASTVLPTYPQTRSGTVLPKTWHFGGRPQALRELNLGRDS